MYDAVTVRLKVLRLVTVDSELERSGSRKLKLPVPQICTVTPLVWGSYCGSERITIISIPIYSTKSLMLMLMLMLMMIT